MINLKGWRTISVQIIAAILPVWDILLNSLAAFVQGADQYSLVTYVPKEWMSLYILALVVINVVLRFKTTSPVGKKL